MKYHLLNMNTLLTGYLFIFALHDLQLLVLESFFFYTDDSYLLLIIASPVSY